MPRRSARDAEGRLEPNLTALLDVVLQLIVFFMMLIHFGANIEASAREVRLPVAAAALPGSDLTLERLVVAIGPDGAILAEDGRELLGDEAAAWWAGEAARRRDEAAGPGAELPTVVVVRADREATYGAVRRVLLDAQGRGFARFTLVVVREIGP